MTAREPQARLPVEVPGPGEGARGEPLEPAPAPRAWRVFHLVKGLGRGGAETLLLETLRASAERNRFTYGYGYLLPHKDALVGPLRESGADVVVCFDAPTPVQALAAARAVARRLRSWGADLLHCHLPLTGIVGRVAGRLAGVPVVYTEHNLQERYHALTRWANGRTWELQRRVLAVSREVADSVRRHHGIEVPVETLHNGVDTERFSPDPQAGRRLRAELGIPLSAPVVGTVAVFRRQKNLELWLEVARRVLRRRPAAHFLLVGDGPLAGELRERAGRLGLAETVHWPGLESDVRPHLAAIDVFLQTSTFEGLPVALLEAMAMERPVVATAVGGVAEAADDTCALLLPAGSDADALAAAVASLLDDEALRARLGRAARARIVSSFSLERMVDDLERVYRELLEERDSKQSAHSRHRGSGDSG